MKYFALHLIIVLLVKINASISESSTYCDVPACTTKSHILCLNNDRHHYRVDVVTQQHILNTLNRYRITLALAKDICNLKMFEWSTEFENMAQAAHKRDLREYCGSTADFKNILAFKSEFNATVSYRSDRVDMELFRKILKQLFTQLTEQPDTNSWIYSAYSNRIGCSYKCNMDMQNCFIICLINGIQLKYFDQSFGYNPTCSEKSTIVDMRCTWDMCAFQPNFICTVTKQFPDAVPIPMTYTFKKFILNKLHDEHKYNIWDNDLQYISERIVIHNLTEHDKCAVLDRFNETFSLEMRGRKQFSEILSNIDSIWMTNQMNINDKIGCALFYADNDFNIYCLYTKTQKSESHLDEAYNWRIILCYVILILVVINVFQIIVLVYLKIFKGQIYEQIYNDC